MALPELVRKTAEKLCDGLCQRLNNDPSQDRLFGYKVEEAIFTLYARSGHCQQMLTIPVARFSYIAELGQWSLQHSDDEHSWRPYLNAGPTLNLGQLIVHVEQDPYGFFRPPPVDPDHA